MESNNNKVSDVLGLASYGEALKIAIEKGFDGASALLSRICLPAAGELGLMYQDKVRYWRLKNIINIVNKAEGKISFEGDQLQIHPRIINEIMETGSWCEDESLSDMWAGLLSSSCDKSPVSDSNILFIQTLKHLTSIQAKLINYICSKCDIYSNKHSLLYGAVLVLTLEELINLTECSNIDQLDAEMDNLRANDLIGGSFSGGGGFQLGDDSLNAHLKPSPFLLNLYAKTQGFKGNLNVFYKDRIKPDADNAGNGIILIDNGP